MNERNKKKLTTNLICKKFSATVDPNLEFICVVSLDRKTLSANGVFDVADRISRNRVHVDHR